MRVLFLSRTDAARGPMALALSRMIFIGAGAEVTCVSAGVEKAATGKVDPRAVSSMKEQQIDIGAHVPRVVTARELAEQDLVVVICERDVAGPLPAGVKKLHWPIMDPADPPAHAAEMVVRYRDARLAIAKHLKALGKLKKGSL